MSINMISGSGWLTAPSCMCQAMSAAHGLAILGKASCQDGFVPYDDAGLLMRYQVVSSAAIGRHVRAFGGAGPSRVRHRPLVDRIEADLKDVRGRLADGEYAEAIPIIRKTISDLEVEAAKGSMLCGRWLSYLYTARVMLKAAEGRERIFREGRGKSSVQVLLIDSSGERILLQKRGLFKRLFPDTFTVSANAKPAPGEDAGQAAAEGVKKEVGIELDPSRFEMVGKERGQGNYLVSFDFHAFSKAEETALESALSEMEMLRGIRMNYNILRRSLTVLTTDPDVSRDEVRRAADSIAERTGIGHIHPVFDRDRNSLMVCRLTKEEDVLVCAKAAEGIARKGKALAGIGGGVDREMLLAIDSDEMRFFDWLEVRGMFKSHPQDFALDLAGPYFGSDAVWEAMEMGLPGIIRADDPAAALPFVSGGKGSNTHFLLELARAIPGLSIPETSVIPASVFKRTVLDDPEIRGQIELLGRACSRARKHEIAAGIRERIGRLELPEDVVLALEEEFRRLGGDVAVRSSANSEDMERHTAAGQAESVMHQLSVDDVKRSVIRVWQSLYSDGFVEYRDSIGFPQEKARMAVLLQKFVSPRAAGVIFSFDPDTRRPVYRITAQPGLGEGSVSGEGSVDFWLVGMTGREILERRIAKKGVRFVEDEGGGSRRERVEMSEPALRDGEVLRLAGIAKEIHQAYRESGRGKHIDLEYVMDREGRPIVVQVRPKEDGTEIDASGKRVYRYETIDIDRLPPGIVPIKFYDRAQIAYQGVAIAVLQVLHSDAKDVRPGVILLAHHTNNEFNSVFGSLIGVITTDGDPTSHAGQHAFEKRIPCIVGALGAFGLLEPYDGRVITFDASARMFVEGVAPVKEVTVALSIWHPDEETVVAENARIDRHEIFRPWEESKAKRAEVFREDFEGRWRRRSNSYGYFQLDYYYRAWDRLTEILNEVFSDRRPWELRTQGRAIKIEERGKSLLHAVTDNDPQSIYYYLKGVDGFSVEDCERLFSMRWKGFREFAGVMDGVESIHAGNVGEVVDGLVDVFAWMHFGFWLDAVVGRFAGEQLQYISDEGSFYNILRSEAAAERAGKGESIDPMRADVPRGRLLYLSRNKDREIYSVLERIRSDWRVAGAFDSGDAAVVRGRLRRASPELYRRIDAWSVRYKNEKEHLDWPSDTDEYLVDLGRRLHAANGPSPGTMAILYRACVAKHGSDALTCEAIERDDPEYHLLLRGQARLIAAREAHAGWAKMSPREQGDALLAVDETAVSRNMPRALKEARDAYEQEGVLRTHARKILDSNPELKRVMALYEMQLALREDGHHLIVPHQRRIAAMMLKAAAPFVPGVFSRPEDVFEIATEEFVALLQERDPSYIKDTFRRNRMLEAAELEMARQWSVYEGHLVALTDDPAGLWNELLKRGWINSDGAIQDKFRGLTDVEGFTLGDEFGEVRAAVYDLLKERFAGVPLKVKAYAAAVGHAIRILKGQETAAALPRVKGYYQREAERLQRRADRLLSSIG